MGLAAWALLCALATVLGTGRALASDPTGIYAVVDKVVLEPTNAPPEQIQIWGVFSLAKPRAGGDEYGAPQRGYLYYKIKPAAKAVCEKEWADLKSVAGTGQCVAFASRWQDKGRVRKAGDKPSQPDEYPVAQGITKIKNSQYPPVIKVLEMARPGSAPGEGNPVARKTPSPE